jgi:hypothetical protein
LGDDRGDPGPRSTRYQLHQDSARAPGVQKCHLVTPGSGTGFGVDELYAILGELGQGAR